MAEVSVLMYAVVYGREWEDILYYTDKDKALVRLFVQTDPTHEMITQHDFYPLLHEYTECNGVLMRLAPAFYINPTLFQNAPYQREDYLQHPGLIVNLLQRMT